MESLEDKIKEFLTVDIGEHYEGANFGSGYSNGKGSGCGVAVGRAHSLGVSEKYIYQREDKNETLFCMNFQEYQSTNCGHGIDDGRGYCNCASASGITIPETKEVYGLKVYIVDSIYTLISAVRGNVAKGFIVREDLQLIPCYIVKDRSHFAHGETLREAYDSLREKMYDDSTEEERIEAFKKKFPKFDQKYNNRDLFAYHHVLTGSCKMGRENFVKERGLSLDGQTTVREFVNLTRYAYGGEIIRKLPMAYHVVVE